MRRRWLAGLVGLAVVATTAACGTGEEAGVGPVTPEGWERVEDGALSFAVPAEWVEAPQSDDLWSIGWSTDPDPGADSLLLVAAPEFGDDGAEQGLDTFVAGAQVGGWGYSSTDRSTPVETDSLEVARNDFTYDGVSGVFWSAADPETGRTVALQLTGRDLPDDVVEGVERSITVRPDASA